MDLPESSLRKLTGYFCWTFFKDKNDNSVFRYILVKFLYEETRGLFDYYSIIYHIRHAYCSPIWRTKFVEFCNSVDKDSIKSEFEEDLDKYKPYLEELIIMELYYIDLIHGSILGDFIERLLFDCFHDVPRLGKLYDDFSPINEVLQKSFHRGFKPFEFKSEYFTQAELDVKDEIIEEFMKF